jgi:truncated hemoglobin YjbI
LSEERIPKRGDRCPVCGLPIDWVERRVVNGHVYYYAWHVITDENGQKRRKKCYLGAERYDYVSRKNIDLGTTFRGMAYDPAQRLAEYVNGALDKLSVKVQSGTLELEEAREWLRAFRDVIARLERFTATLEEYVRRLEATAEAVNETVAKAQPLEAPPKTSQPQAAEARQGEAYRAVSTLTGLSPEDIEKELAKLKEALKELKASH